jgi:hypothetical protein
MTHVVSYSLRNPDDTDEVYGEEIADQSDALARARELADFYRRPVEVCRAALGHTVQRVALVEPGPTAPAPLTEADPSGPEP